MKTAFVTGIGGFVGGHLAKKLLEKGYNVVGLSRDFSTKKTLDMLGIGDKVTLVYGDILDKRVVQRALLDYRPEYLFHLAGVTIVGSAIKIPSETFLVNCAGTANVLEACRDIGIVKSILVASTDKVYGEGMRRTEDSQLDAVGIYETSKVVMECVAKTFFKVYAMPIVISRACNIYGEFDTNSRIVPNTIKKIKNNEQPVIFKNDDSVREYIYVDDVCSALVMLAENIDKTKGEIFNIGTGHVVSQEEMVRKILEATSKKIEPVYTDKKEQFFEIKKQSLDSKKIMQVFGWKPKYSLEEGLKKTWEAESCA